MKSKVLLACLLLSIVLGVGGCGTKLLGKDTIISDIGDAYDIVKSVGEIVETYEVISRQTDKESLVDTILCKIVSSDNEANYTKYYELEYVMNENDEWVIDSFVPQKQEEWSVVPAAGVKDIDIKSYLIGGNFTIGGELWHIDSLSVGEVKEKSRTTDLENRNDTVIVSVELLSDVLVARGELQANYVYDNGWHLQSVDIVKDFEATYQEDKKFEMTETTLVEAMTQNPIPFGKGSNGTRQDIVVRKDEVTEFVMGETLVSNVGTVQICDCSFVINKETASMKVSANVSYEYDFGRGWIVRDVQYSKCDVKELRLEGLKGEWVGQMSEFDTTSLTMQSVKFEITEVDNAEGRILATISVPTEKRSCELIGYVDFIDLTFKFVFDKWIEKPIRNASLYEPVLCGLLILDDVAFECFDNHDSNDFELRKVD